MAARNSIKHYCGHLALCGQRRTYVKDRKIRRGEASQISESSRLSDRAVPGSVSRQ